MRGWLLVALQGALLLALVLAPHRSAAATPLIAGGVVMALGAWLLVAAIRALGRALTPTPVPNRTGLVTTAVYARLRHPIYTALLLMAVGWVIAIGTWWSALAALALVLLFLAKARWEDTMLAEVYGDDWRDWARRTGSLIPRVRQG